MPTLCRTVRRSFSIQGGDFLVSVRMKSIRESGTAYDASMTGNIHSVSDGEGLMELRGDGLKIRVQSINRRARVRVYVEGEPEVLKSVKIAEV